jgi:hypothetical protein
MGVLELAISNLPSIIETEISRKARVRVHRKHFAIRSSRSHGGASLA